MFEGDDDGAAGETHYLKQTKLNFVDDWFLIGDCRDVLRLKGIRGHHARRGRILPLRFMR